MWKCVQIAENIHRHLPISIPSNWWPSEYQRGKKEKNCLWKIYCYWWCNKMFICMLCRCGAFMWPRCGHGHAGPGSARVSTREAARVGPGGRAAQETSGAVCPIKASTGWSQTGTHTRGRKGQEGVNEDRRQYNAEAVIGFFKSTQKNKIQKSKAF